MAWTIEFEKAAEKELGKLDTGARKSILRYLRDRVLAADNPRQLGKALKGELGGLWRYRVGDYRIVCQIEDAKLIVLVLRVAHRRETYR